MKSLFILSFLALFGCIENDNRGYKVNVGENVPEFSFNLLDGTTVSNETIKGKVTVLQFTASWCGVCRKEMPHLEKEVWQRFKNQDFNLIGIDLEETVEKTQEFIKETGVTYPIGIDTDRSIFEKFTLPKAGVTRNIVIDREGKIIFLSRLFDLKEFNAMIEVIEKEVNKK
jgi:peroxiredoxin